jgi:hypothetical protein
MSLLTSCDVKINNTMMNTSITGEAKQMKLHPKKINHKAGLSINKLWKPLIHFLRGRWQQVLSKKRKLLFSSRNTTAP